MHYLPKRSNAEWLDAPRGVSGLEEKNHALTSLANYLFVVVCNGLQKQRSHILKLQHLSNDELTLLAEEFVQRDMGKMVAANFALRINIASAVAFWPGQPR